MCKSTCLLHCPLWVKKERLLISHLKDRSDLSIYWPTGRCNWFGLFSPSYATTSNRLSLAEKINDTINLSAVGRNHEVVDKIHVHNFKLGVETRTQVSPWKREQPALGPSPLGPISCSEPFPKDVQHKRLGHQQSKELPIYWKQVKRYKKHSFSWRFILL